MAISMHDALRARQKRSRPKRPEVALVTNGKAHWRRFRDSFADDADAVLENMRTAFLSSVDNIPLGDLVGTVLLFRQLGRPEIATELIGAFVQSRRCPSPSTLTPIPSPPSLMTRKFLKRFGLPGRRCRRRSICKKF